MASNFKNGGRMLKVAAFVGGFALALGLGVAERAHAQQHTGVQRTSLGERAGFDPAVHFARMCDTMEARQAGMLAYAEVRLGITDAERPAWTKFAGTVKAAAAPMKQVCASVVAQPAPKTLPDHLHRMEQIETARLEQLRQITPAVEELYGSLTAKQREIADHLVGDMMHEPGPQGPGCGPHHPPMDDAPAPANAPN
ncbi:hypothetical protein GCM10011611_18540 [Aliidongia dinghuensis]|uniref:LTXXQ motif family protein n=1 Tax=Aliidongia dinghuensis TaxID=1867774 RepID=A0A8J2YSA8_9PROT|nr:Spy/CpxP family protein refolding chaperone [Aliidongia dinghuensis]GGF13128.1 hypothetical protein GCM10011611_18540 [Aliidongia dinghuensis]